MANKRRFVDVVSTKLRFSERSPEEKSFKDVLLFLDGKEFRYQSKIFEFDIVNSNVLGCIIGIVITTQDKDIPPARNKTTKQFSRLNLNVQTEGLAFANIFLYDFNRNILIYEINKYGCFLSQFKSFIYDRWNEVNEDIRFDLSFPSICRANEYSRMLSMDYYKKVTVELLNPKELIDCFTAENDSIANNIMYHNIRASNSGNADILKVEQVTLQKKYNPNGLSQSVVKGIVDTVKMNIIDQGFKRNVARLVVDGYTDDSEDPRKLKPIDLLADTFNEYFKITDIRVQADVQQNERKVGITELYNRILPELITILG